MKRNVGKYSGSAAVVWAPLTAGKAEAGLAVVVALAVQWQLEEKWCVDAGHLVKNG